MIPFIIIMSVLLLFVLIFSVHAKVIIELRDELSLTVSVLGIKIPILPKKPKKYNLKKYTLKKIAKRDEKAEKERLEAEKKKAEKAKKKAEKAKEKKRQKAALKKMSRKERRELKAKKRASRPAIPDMISLFSEVIGLFFSGFLSHLHVYVARIRITVGSDEAAKTAILHTAICQALYPTLIFLDRKSNLHGIKKADVYIEPDFCSEKISADVKIAFSLNLFGLLCTVLKPAFRFLIGWSEIKPSPTTEAPTHLHHNLSNGNSEQKAAETNEEKSAETNNESN